MIEVPAIRTTRTRYPEQLKALAFELYAYTTNQDMPATIRLLNEQVDHPVSEKSVYAWRSEFEWDKRIAEQRRAMAPVSWELWCSGISVAGPLAISRLSAIMDDPAASHRDQIAAARAIASLYAEHAEMLLALATEEPAPPAATSNDELQAIESTPGWE
jgi:hypothetical protein